MINDKEKALLDFVYHQGEELIKFLKNNHYGEEHKQISLYVLRGQVYYGKKVDYIRAASSYWRKENVLHRIVSKSTDYNTGKPEMNESKYEV